MRRRGLEPPPGYPGPGPQPGASNVLCVQIALQRPDCPRIWTEWTIWRISMLHGAGTQPPAPTPRAVARFEKEDWNLHLVIPSQALTCPSVLVPRAREIVLAGFDDHRLVPHLVAHAHDALLDARERAAAAVLDK